jgi:PPM family protein phosphatase
LAGEWIMPVAPAAGPRLPGEVRVTKGYSFVVTDQIGSTSRLDYAAGTTTGARRSINEDAFGIFPESHVFVVADGLGGRCTHPAELAVAQFAELLRSEPAVRAAETDPLASAVLRANAEILRDALANPERRGQGAALCAVRAATDTIGIVHVGDCRVGRYRDGRLSWLTEDHTLAWELRRNGASDDDVARVAKMHPNVIVRALGMADSIAVDPSHHPALAGDTYLLCSDGLTGQVDLARISEIIGDSARGLHKQCRALLEASEAAGGRDNATVILLRLRGSATSSTR